MLTSRMTEPVFCKEMSQADRKNKVGISFAGIVDKITESEYFYLT